MSGRISEIQRTVAAHFGTTVREMKSARRNRIITRPRQIAMYLSRELTPNSLPAIGRLFNRDHTTVMHAIDTIERIAKADPSFERHIAHLRSALTS